MFAGTEFCLCVYVRECTSYCTRAWDGTCMGHEASSGGVHGWVLAEIKEFLSIT